MSAIDPSYIRNIRDGLKNENIEANNLEALPEGLVALYDRELFPSSLNWKQRKETLQFFLVFALAQKEISADFASTILGDEWCKVLSNENETSEEKRLKKVNEFIQLHSKRFTSAGEGKYRLYHERFRVYILQKVSEGVLAQFNQLFISLCESELKNNTGKDIPEKERYALEFLSTHYFISAMQGEKVCLNANDAASLKNLAYDQVYWERQVKASKGFEWSKKMLNEMMQWASKFDEEEVIECALNKVDLYHQEQNDVPRIVQLVADGDIETALERIEKFGGEDKEGLQRKFILYMLCLMELTLLDSKGKEHTKVSIEKILKHFDEQIPEDYSLLNWSDFFPSYLMFQIACKCSEIGLNYLVLFKRTYVILDTEWISEINQFNLNMILVLDQIAQFITIDKATKIAPKHLDYIELEKEQSLLFYKISSILTHQENIESAIKIINKIKRSNIKVNAIKEIYVKLIKIGDIELAESLYKEAFLIHKQTTLSLFTPLFAKQGKINESILNSNEIENSYLRSKSLLNISIELYLSGELNKSNEILNESLAVAQNIDWPLKKSEIISEIADEYVKKDLIEDALNLISEIEHYTHKTKTLLFIVSKLSEQGKFEEAIRICIMPVHLNGLNKDEKAIYVIAFERAKLGLINEAIEIIELVYYNVVARFNLYVKLIKELNVINHLDYSDCFFNKSIETLEIISLDTPFIETILPSICILSELHRKKNKIKLADEILKKGIIFFKKSFFKKYNSSEINSLNIIYNYLNNLSKKELADEIINECLEFISKNYEDESNKMTHLFYISKLINKNNPIKANQIEKEIYKIFKEYELSNEIRSSKNRSYSNIVLYQILEEKSLNKSFVDVFLTMKNFLVNNSGILNPKNRNNILLKINSEYLKSEKYDNAIFITNYISGSNETYNERHLAFKEIINSLIDKGNIDYALKLTDNIEDSRILDSIYESFALNNIKKNQLEDALSYILKINTSDHELGINRLQLFSKIIELDVNGSFTIDLINRYDIISTLTPNNLLKKIELHSIVFQRLVKLGKKEHAKVVINKAINFVNKNYNIDSIILISNAFYNVGEFEFAINLLEDEVKYLNENNKGRQLFFIIDLLKFSKAFFYQSKIEESNKLIDEAIKISDKLEESWMRDEAMYKISISLLQIGKIEKSKIYAEYLSRQDFKEEFLCELIKLLSLEGDFNECLVIENSIFDLRTKFFVRKYLYELLTKGTNFDEKLSLKLIIDKRFINYFNTEKKQSYRDLDYLLNELFNKKEIDLIEKIISQLNTSARFFAYDLLGEIFLKSNSYDDLLRNSILFKNTETLIYLKRVLLNKFNINNIDKSLLLKILKDFSLEIKNIEKLLQLFTLNELFFEDLPQEKLNRYNRTLNLQWAIDIKNQLPN